jgi:hypothetical protein
LSAAGDSQILLHEIDELNTSNDQTTHIQKWVYNLIFLSKIVIELFKECGGRVKKLVTCHAEPKLFFSASEDGMLKLVN